MRYMDSLGGTPRIRRAVGPIFIFFLPSFLFAFIILQIIAGNGFLDFTTKPDMLPDHHPLPFRETLSRSQILTVEREIPSSDPTQFNSVENTNGSVSVPVLESTASSPASLFKQKKQRYKRQVEIILKALHSNTRSRLFSTKANDFFQGGGPNGRNASSKYRCESRFFMTWISSLESFGQREMIAVESLFKFHPDACLIILSNSMDSVAGTKLLHPFAEKGYRVSAFSPDYEYMFKNTAAELWFSRLRNGEINPGEISLGQNLSNLLRLAVLYKYGGIYIDTDVIILKSFDRLQNVIGAQTSDPVTGNWTRLNNAIMVFDKNHPLLCRFIEDFTQRFDGSRWGFNGPYMVSRVVVRFKGKPGYDFKVLPTWAFYPVDWSRISGYFRAPVGIPHSKWVTSQLLRIQKQSFALHLWNHQSKKLKVENGSIIGKIMLDCCLFCNSTSSSRNL